MIIAGKAYKEIQILTVDNELLVSIADKDIIEREGCKVVCVPAID
ncbi:MAG: hypothetical protein ACLTT1_11320 [[Clostridium] scindens]